MDQDGKFSRNYHQSEEEISNTELRRGPWTADEDFTLINYVARHGEGRWNSLARCAGLKRTGKSCRLRWLNYLRPDVRRGNITLEEQLLILELHSRWGNRWSKIAQHLPGRTDNEIKNYWRTRVHKHAKQLKCDVNSKQFKDTMRYLWMPRLVERIQAASGNTTAGATVPLPPPSTTTTEPYLLAQNDTNPDMGQAQLLNQPIISYGWANTYTPDNSSVAASSDSFGTPVSDLTDCYNNYPVNNNNNNNNGDIINQDYYCNPNDQLLYGGDHQSGPTSPMGFFGQGMDFLDQNGPWMDCGDGPDGLWNADDVWFLQQHQLQFNCN